MLGARWIGGSGKEKRPCASLLVCAISCMPCDESQQGNLVAGGRLARGAVGDRAGNVLRGRNGGEQKGTKMTE